MGVPGGMSQIKIGEAYMSIMAITDKLPVPADAAYKIDGKRLNTDIDLSPKNALIEKRTRGISTGGPPFHSIHPSLLLVLCRQRIRGRRLIPTSLGYKRRATTFSLRRGGR